LTEMDGFENNSGIIVIAATNRIEMLDSALLRPGRFDRRIFVPLPDMQEREAILHLYMKKKPHSLNISELARTTVGFSAAALSTLVNEAALHALRRQKSGNMMITYEDFEAVKERVISGKRRILSFNEKERKIQAVYQSGKIVAATWLDVSYEQIGIVTTRLREIDREITSRTDFLNRIKVYLAGSAATYLIFNERYSNNAEDMERAVELADKIVRKYAMGKEIVTHKDEVQDLLMESYREVEQLLKKLDKGRLRIETYLLEHENIREAEAKRMLDELF